MDYSENFQRFKVSDEIYDSWTRDHQPYIATVELTPCCNFRCIHCYLGVHREEKQVLSFADITRILDELREGGVLQIALTGGECMLRSDFIEIYEYAKKSGFIVTVFTNASCISPKVIESLKKYPPFSVEISLYGASEETYYRITGQRCFGKVINNIRSLYEAGIKISLKTPLIKQNSSDEGELRKIASEFGTELRIGFAMSPTIDQELYPVDFAIDLEERFLHEVKSSIGLRTGLKEADIDNPWGALFDAGEFVPQYICNPGVSDVFVDYLGNVCPCVAYRTLGKSLLQSKFSEIWDSFRYLKCIPARKDNKCMRCESRFFCTICVGEQDVVHNDPCFIPKDVCIYAHARMLYYKKKMSVEEVLKYIRSSL